MPLDASITVSPNLEAALKALKPDVMAQAIGRGLLRATKLIQGKIEATRLRGKGPFPPAQNKLGIVTGRLRQSLNSSGPTISGGQVQTSIGSNVSYAAVHEFGFSGTQKVKAGRMKITQVFGRKLKNPLTVQRHAFSRKMSIPERAPIRTGIKENLNLIETEIEREVLKSMRATP